MSREEHRQAIRVFTELENMDAAVRLDALRDEDHEAFATPCTAGLTAVLFHRLKVSVDERDILWLKLWDRPVGRVFNLWLVAKDEKPEKLNALFTAFAKKVKPLGILKVPA